MADSLRGREEAEPPPPPPTATTEALPEPPRPNPGVVRRLRDAGLSGTLIVSGADCRVLSLELPELLTTEHAGAACSVRPPRTQEAPLRLTDDDLRRTGVTDPQVLDRVRLSPSRTAVLLPWPAGGYVLAVFEGREPIASHRWGAGAPARLSVAPGGALFAARPARVFRRDGTPVTLAPRFRNARAVEWSPDGNWVALAMVGAVVLVETQGLVGGDEASRAIRLPYPADDLVWRPG